MGTPSEYTSWTRKRQRRETEVASRESKNRHPLLATYYSSSSIQIASTGHWFWASRRSSMLTAVGSSTSALSSSFSLKAPLATSTQLPDPTHISWSTSTLGFPMLQPPPLCRSVAFPISNIP